MKSKCTNFLSQLILDSLAVESIRQKLNVSDNTLQSMVLTLYSYICNKVLFIVRPVFGSSNMDNV